MSFSRVGNATFLIDDNTGDVLGVRRKDGSIRRFVVGGTTTSTTQALELSALLNANGGTWGEIGGTIADQEDLQLEFDGKADYLAVRDESTAAWTLNAENHANTSVEALNAGAIAVTWTTGHGMTRGDCGEIFQTGAGAVTITAVGDATLNLGPGAASAVTSAQWGHLEWRYMGSDVLLITRRT